MKYTSYAEMNSEQRAEFGQRCLDTSNWLRLMGEYTVVQNELCCFWEVPYTGVQLIWRGCWAIGGTCMLIASRINNVKDISTFAYRFIDEAGTVAVAESTVSLNLLGLTLDAFDLFKYRRVLEIEGFNKDFTVRKGGSQL